MQGDLYYAFRVADDDVKELETLVQKKKDRKLAKGFKKNLM
nr:hypothetical protein GTC16762_13490 [Pigmentibacter ruber]